MAEETAVQEAGKLSGYDGPSSKTCCISALFLISLTLV